MHFSQVDTGSSVGHSNRPDTRQDVTANAPITHRPSWSSSAPSAGWSASSPAASWGTSQTGISAHTADQGSSGQSLLQKAKASLPGGTSSHANGQSTTDNSETTLLEKAKQYLPGSNGSQYTEQNNAGQMHGATDLHDISVVKNLNSLKPVASEYLRVWPLQI